MGMTMNENRNFFAYNKRVYGINMTMNEATTTTTIEIEIESFSVITKEVEKDVTHRFLSKTQALLSFLRLKSSL